MSKDETESIKRESSLKPEKDDLTDYGLLNSLGGAGVLGQAEADSTGEPTERESTNRESTDRESAAPEAADSVVTFDEGGGYNDNVAVAPVDTDGQTNT